MIRVAGNTIVLAAALFGAAASAAGPQVEVTTLAGRRHSGALTSLSAEQASLVSNGTDVRVPLAEILEVRTIRDKSILPPDTRRAEMTLTDGSRLFWSAFRADDRQVAVETPRFGKFTIALTAVSSVRLASLDPQVAGAWRDLCARELTQDMLVIRKENILDHLDGIVGTINETDIRFVHEGEDVPVKRAKVFGVIYARRNADPGKPICEIAGAGGDLLKAQSAAGDAAQLTIGLLGGAQLAIPAEDVVSYDFSLGKVRFLSQMEPRDVKYTPFFDHVWKYHRDRQRDGGPLRLGNKEYARGLWIHSRTLLRYRLNADYRRFQAVMGIDQAVAPRGDVHVVISGDGKTLYESDVRGADAPQTLDLDVAGVRELEILVDFGGDLDIADHLDLCDAKVIK